MKYTLYCILSALALVISCTGTMTNLLKRYQYCLLAGYAFFVMYMSWGCWGQMLTFFSVGGTVLIASVFLRPNIGVNFFIGLCTHLFNSAFNNGLLWILGMLDRGALEAVLDRYLLFFSAGWIGVLVCLTVLYRYLLYTKYNIKKYLSFSNKIQLGIVTEIVLFAILFVLNISMGQRAGYTVRTLGFNSSLLIGSLMVNLVLLFYLGNAMRSEEERRAYELSYRALEDYTRSLEHQYDRIRLLRHDYKNILSSAAGYIRTDDMESLKVFLEKEIIPTLSEQMDNSSVSESLSRLQPLELKSFLYEKCIAASAKDITVHCEVSQQMEVCGIEQMDLIRVLGIYMDNAIEEASEGDSRDIWVVFIDEDNGMSIRIENTWKEKALSIDKLGTQGYSTKGKGRGLGLYSAKKILDSYSNVYYETGLKDHIFCQMIYIEKV